MESDISACWYLLIKCAATASCLNNCTSPHILICFLSAHLKALAWGGAYNIWLFPVISLQWMHWCSCGKMANKWLICVHADNIWWRLPHILPAHCIKLSFNKGWCMKNITFLPLVLLEKWWNCESKSQTQQKACKINNIMAISQGIIMICVILPIRKSTS